MIHELDTVVLVNALDEKGLKQGDVGAVAHCYPNDATYEVEFVTAEGRTIALITLTTADIRPMKDSEILHVREFTSA